MQFLVLKLLKIKVVKVLFGPPIYMEREDQYLYYGTNYTNLMSSIFKFTGINSVTEKGLVRPP